MGAWSIPHALVKHIGADHRIGFLDPDQQKYGGSGETGALTRRQGKPRSQTLKIACKSCNNGWMKKIVDDAIPVLTQMNYGYWGPLSSADVISIARWIVLYSMSYEFADKKTVCVTFEERNRFFKTQDIGNYWDIAIGYGEIKTWSDPTFHRAFKVVDASFHGNANLNVTSFYFGKLLVVSHYSEYPSSFDFTGFAKKEALVAIWPNTPDRIHKPFYAHDDYAVDDLIRKFTDLINSEFL